MTQSVTVSTGHTFDLPVSLSASVAGAVFPVNREGVAALLPDGLTPISTWSDRAALTVLAVQYDRVGADTIDPYNEVAVIIPAAETGTRTVPVWSILRRPMSGYVYTLPVSTEPARAFGVDIWGYPKLVADIDIAADGRTRTASVTVADEPLVTMTVQRPPTIPARVSGSNVTVMDDTLHRVPIQVRGRVGAWPLSVRASVSFGDHRIGRRLQNLDIGDRALVRLAGDCEFTFGVGTPLDH